MFEHGTRHERSGDALDVQYVCAYGRSNEKYDDGRKITVQL